MEGVGFRVSRCSWVDAAGMERDDDDGHMWICHEFMSSLFAAAAVKEPWLLGPHSCGQDAAAKVWSPENKHARR